MMVVIVCLFRAKPEKFSPPWCAVMNLGTDDSDLCHWYIWPDSQLSAKNFKLFQLPQSLINYLWIGKTNNLSDGAIAGIAIGVFAGVAAIGSVVGFAFYKERKNKKVFWSSAGSERQSAVEKRPFDTLVIFSETIFGRPDLWCLWRSYEDG